MMILELQPLFILDLKVGALAMNLLDIAVQWIAWLVVVMDNGHVM